MSSSLGRLLVVGLSHHTAPVAVREKVAIPKEELHGSLSHAVSDLGLQEAMWLSTCNRVELYGVASDPRGILPALRGQFLQRAGESLADEFLYAKSDEDAVRHAFRVSASLDSMVVGEPQILGQVKEAYAQAQEQGAVRGVLGRCLMQAFGAAKRVRSETTIAQGAVSISSVAVDLTGQIFGDLRSRKVLLVGAGKMGEAAARKLAKSGAKLIVINRSEEKARELAASCGGQHREYSDLLTELAVADVAITSTGSQDFILPYARMQDVVRLRKRRPLFLVDIAVPRNIDPRSGSLDNVFLYDVDDLQEVADRNLATRRKSQEKAEALIEEEVIRFLSWHRGLRLTPTIVALRKQVGALVEQELLRGLPPELRSELSAKQLDRLRDSVVGKLLHQPITELRSGANGPDGPLLIDMVRRLFSIAEEDLSVEDSAPEVRSISLDAGVSLDAKTSLDAKVSLGDGVAKLPKKGEVS